MQALPTILPPPPLPDGSEAPARSSERHANLVRFQSELEVSPSGSRRFISGSGKLMKMQFIQCLAHPQYLHELHIQGYLEKPPFLNYLKYLEYWKEPQYVRFIMCVRVLTISCPVYDLAIDGIADILHVWYT